MCTGTSRSLWKFELPNVGDFFILSIQGFTVKSSSLAFPWAECKSLLQIATRRLDTAIAPMVDMHKNMVGIAFGCHVLISNMRGACLVPKQNALTQIIKISVSNKIPPIHPKRLIFGDKRTGLPKCESQLLNPNTFGGVVEADT